jgi:hypothetical protein
MAKAWPRRHEDPLARHQGWTCPIYHCWKGYKTAYGMIAELSVHQETYWFRTPVKDWDTLDLQACMLEQEKNPLTPEQLYESLPSLRPQRFEALFVQAADRLQDGVDRTMVYRIVDKALWLSTPEFAWDNVFAQFHVDRYHGKKKLNKL